MNRSFQAEYNGQKIFHNFFDLNNDREKNSFYYNNY